MQNQLSERIKPLKTISRPLLALGLVLVLLVISALWFVNRQAFNAIQTEMENLTKPKTELQNLHNLQLEISLLIQDHRSEAIQDLRKPSDLYFKRLQRIRQEMIHLNETFQNQPNQRVRLQQIDSILNDRTRLFERYLQSRYTYVHTGQFDQQFEKLAMEVEKNALKMDSNVVSTSHSTKRYTYYEPEIEQTKPEEKKGWFKRKKKSEEKASNPKVLVEEKVDVQVDTLALISNKDSLLSEIKLSLNQLKKRQNKGRNYLENLELVLINSNQWTLQTVLSIIDDLRIEEELAAKKSHEKSLQISAQALFYSRLLSIGFVLILLVLIALLAWDFTRMKRYRQQLEEAKQLAELHSQARQRFLSTMSHELRTPVQSIIGFSAWLNEQKRFDEEKVKGVHQSAEHLLHVVNEVLDLARITSGKLTLNEQAFSLDTWLSELDLLFRDRMKDKKLDWQIFSEVDADSWFLGDAYRLKQIAINLVGNSLKFTEKGWVKVRVRFEKNESIWEFSDSGSGMNPDAIDRIFREFEQAELEHQAQGSGLGLNLVSELVQAFDGRLEVESEKNVGTTFRVRIPLKRTDAPVHIEQNSKSDQKAPIHCWFVDDDPLILQVIESMLEHEPFSKRFFSNPLDVLATEIPSQPLLIFTDLNMPEMKGDVLMQQIRPKLKKTDRIILLTAQVLPEEMKQLQLLDFDAILGKPFQKQALLETLQTVIPNVDISLEHLAGFDLDEEMKRELKQSFVDECLADFTVLKTFLSQKDREQTRLILHRLAGRMQQFHWNEGINARRLETEISQKETKIWQEIVDWVRHAEAEICLLQRS